MDNANDKTKMGQCVNKSSFVNCFSLRKVINLGLLGSFDIPSLNFVIASENSVGCVVGVNEGLKECVIALSNDLCIIEERESLKMVLVSRVDKSTSSQICFEISSLESSSGGPRFSNIVSTPVQRSVKRSFIGICLFLKIHTQRYRHT